MNHKFGFAMCRDKIREIQAQLKEKQLIIKKKQQEILELEADQEEAENEVDNVKKEKNSRISRILDNMSKLDQQ